MCLADIRAYSNIIVLNGATIKFEMRRVNGRLTRTTIIIWKEDKKISSESNIRKEKRKITLDLYIQVFVSMQWDREIRRMCFVCLSVCVCLFV